MSRAVGIVGPVVIGKAIVCGLLQRGWQATGFDVDTGQYPDAVILDALALHDDGDDLGHRERCHETWRAILKTPAHRYAIGAGTRI